MNPLAACKVAIAALKVNALRSFLAMLGVIIGVASVIVMVSVASGASQAIEARIRALGTNLLIVSPGSFTSGGRRAGEGTAQALSEGDLQIIRAKVPGIAAIAIGTKVSPSTVQILSSVASALLGATMTAAVIYATYLFAGPLLRRLSNLGMIVLMRLAAFILLCVGIEILWSGIAELLSRGS